MMLLAGQASALQAAFDAAKNLGEFGARYDHSKIVDFQTKSNAVISMLYPSGGPVAKLTPDGTFGSNTAARLMTYLTPVAPGLPNMPVSAASVPTWWIGVRAAVTQGASARIAQLTSAIGQHAPDNVTGSDASRLIDAATQTDAQTIAQISQQTSTRGPAGTTTSNGGASQGGPIQLPAELITGTARRGATWPWVVGGVGLVALAGVLLYGASKRRGAAKHRKYLRKA